MEEDDDGDGITNEGKIEYRRTILPLCNFKFSDDTDDDGDDLPDEEEEADNDNDDDGIDDEVDEDDDNDGILDVGE